MNFNHVILTGLFFLAMFSLVNAGINIQPNSINLSMYGGETHQVPLYITSTNNADIVGYLTYTTSLEDMNGIELTTTNPFVIKANQQNQIPLFIKTVPNFNPTSFDINLYVDGNLEQVIIENIVYGGGGGSTTITRTIDKNVYVDKNIIVEKIKEVPKEQIKYIVKNVDKNVYIEKPVTPEHNNNLDLTNLFLGLIIGGAITLFSLLLLKIVFKSKEE